jgi:hypothetical protein
MSTRLRALALFVACCTAGVAAHAQEVDNLLPLPPIESELLDQAGQPDYLKQDVEYVDETAPVYHNILQDQWSETRFLWDTDVIVFDSEWGPDRKEDTLAAIRYGLSLEHQSGLGVRAQYTTLDPSWNVIHDPGATEIVNPDPGDIYIYTPYYKGAILLNREVDNLNLDVYKRIEVGATEIRLGAGLTSVRSIEQFHTIYDFTPPDGVYFYSRTDHSIKGVGIGLSGDLRRAVYARDTWEVAFLLGGRTSYVPVEQEAQSELLSTFREHDMKLHEGRVGLEVLKKINAITAIASCQYEVQHWDNDTTDVWSFDGVNISLGLQW